MAKKVITFEPTEDNKYVNFIVDGVRKDTGYPTQLSSMLRREFGLTALTETDVTEETHPEAYKQYIEYQHLPLLLDWSYTRYANIFYARNAEDGFQVTSMTAQSEQTYKYYKQLTDAGFRTDIAFTYAFSHHVREHMQGIQHKSELAEIDQILSK